MLRGLLARVAMVIFAVEVVLILTFKVRPPGVYRWIDVVLDASMLSILSTMILYRWIVKPLDDKLKTTINELQRAKAEAERRSRYDTLTCALNRHTFFEQFEQEWERTLQSGTPLSCVMLDLDFFKNINDTYGHLAGDAALAAVAGLLARHCHTNHVIGRFGGEEFCLVLTETEWNEAVGCAHRLRAAIEAHPVNHGDQTFFVTASFGVAQHNHKTSSVSELLDSADRALLRAKQLGRNRVEVAAIAGCYA